MKKIILVLLLIICIVVPTNIYANDYTTEEKIFDTEEDAQEWLDSFSSDKYEIKKSGIVSKEIYGVTETPVDDRGYTVDIKYNEETGVPIKVIINITGGYEEIDIDFAELKANNMELANAYNYMEPGDSGEIEIDFVNDTDDDYITKTYTHLNSDLMKYDANGVREATEDEILNSFVGSLSNQGDPVLQALREEYPDVTFDTKHKDILFNYLTKDFLLDFYNKSNGTENVDLVTAWKEYFFKNCWMLIYTFDWNNLELDSGVTYEDVVQWELDGQDTNNTFQNTCWGWNDELILKCKNKTQYTATIVYKQKTSSKKEKKNNNTDEEKEKDGVPTGDSSNLYKMLLYCGLSSFGLIGILYSSKKNKED